MVYLTVSGRTARLCRTHPSRPRRGSGTLLVWGRLTLKRFFWPALLHQNGAQRASAPAPSSDRWLCSCLPLCRSFHGRSGAPRPCGFTAAHWTMGQLRGYTTKGMSQPKRIPRCLPVSSSGGSLGRARTERLIQTRGGTMSGSDPSLELGTRRSPWPPFPRGSRGSRLGCSRCSFSGSGPLAVSHYSDGGGAL